MKKGHSSTNSWLKRTFLVQDQDFFSYLTKIIKFRAKSAARVCIKLLPKKSPAKAGLRNINGKSCSGDGHAGVEIHILNGVEDGDAVLHRPLERLAPGNQAHAAGTLVDHRRHDRRFEVARALGLAA
jgi:hypothetical protein